MSNSKLVRVNVENGHFDYADKQGEPAESIKVLPGDHLAWDVRLNGARTAFQISFKSLSPFRKTKEIRSDGGMTTPIKVETIHIDKGLPYTVTLPNGWSNDPEARVEGADGEVGPPKITSAEDVVIEFEPDKNGNISIDPVSHVRKGWIEWRTFRGEFEIVFDGGKSPFKEPPPPLKSVVGKLSRRVKLNAELGQTYT